MKGRETTPVQGSGPCPPRRPRIALAPLARWRDCGEGAFTLHLRLGWTHVMGGGRLAPDVVVISPRRPMSLMVFSPETSGPETSEVGTYTASAGLFGRLSMHRTLPSYLCGTQREEVKLGE